jgi:hypothetical protein
MSKQTETICARDQCGITLNCIDGEKFNERSSQVGPYHRHRDADAIVVRGAG